MQRSHLSYSLAVFPVFGSTALACNHHMLKWHYWDHRLLALTGQVAAIQPILVFLRYCLTSAEASKPTKTVVFHRYLEVMHSDPELSHPTYCRPWSSLFSLFTSFPICHVTPSVMLSNTVHNPILLGLHHWPTSPSGSPLSFLAWGFHHWYCRMHLSLSIQLQDLTSRIRAPRLEHLLLMARNGGESVSDSPEA